MRIVLATPFYPPDTEDPAPYVKELAQRLSSLHTITVVTYGSLPEKISGVTILAVDKRQPIFFRLFSYALTLWRVARTADVVYAENGPSVEMPVGIAARVTRTPFMVHIGDASAHSRATKEIIPRLLERFATSAACAVISDMPLPKPEVLPFSPEPRAAQEAHRASWEEHLRLLNATFAHA